MSRVSYLLGHTLSFRGRPMNLEPRNPQEVEKKKREKIIEYLCTKTKLLASTNHVRKPIVKKAEADEWPEKH